MPAAGITALRIFIRPIITYESVSQGRSSRFGESSSKPGERTHRVSYPAWSRPVGQFRSTTGCGIDAGAETDRKPTASTQSPDSVGGCPKLSVGGRRLPDVSTDKATADRRSAVAATVEQPARRVGARSCSGMGPHDEDLVVAVVDDHRDVRSSMATAAAAAPSGLARRYEDYCRTRAQAPTAPRRRPSPCSIAHLGDRRRQPRPGLHREAPCRCTTLPPTRRAGCSTVAATGPDGPRSPCRCSRPAIYARPPTATDSRRRCPVTACLLSVSCRSRPGIRTSNRSST